MAKRFVTPAQRRRRILRDALLLAAVLVVLVLRLDFPILTARQAVEATQVRYHFGPGRAIAAVDRQAVPSRYSLYYILRDGDWYAWCGVNRNPGQPFWYSGKLEAVENDPDLPLVSLMVDDSEDGLIVVISNDPEITQVEVVFPVHADGGFTPFSTQSANKVENCFLVSYTISDQVGYYPEDFQVKGYDAAGALVYRSPTPESWTTRYELR